MFCKVIHKVIISSIYLNQYGRDFNWISLSDPIHSYMSELLL